MYALLGASLKHSISPQIHNLFMKALDVQDSYGLLETTPDNLERIISDTRYQGFNVTIPYKVQVIPYLDEISAEAGEIGAVNTIYRKAGKVCGDNTDYFGFAHMLAANNISVTGKTVVVLGWGGAAKTVVTYMQHQKAAQIIVVSRNPQDSDVPKYASCISYEELNIMPKMDIVVNTTPCGMFPNVDKSPINEAIVQKFTVAVDLIYNPAMTLFLQYAQKSGLQFVNGLHMLVAQAARAQEIWQGQVISADSLNEVIKTMQVLYE